LKTPQAVRIELAERHATGAVQDIVASYGARFADVVSGANTKSAVIARDAVYAHLSRRCMMSTNEIGDMFGISASTASVAIRRHKRREAERETVELMQAQQGVVG
jgi:chromosomal replication initiation ATPase DnaA